MQTDLEKHQAELTERGTLWVRGGDDQNIQIIANGHSRWFNADGSDQNTESSAAMAEMPRYQCHKKVWALKIAKIEQGDDRNSFLTMHFVEKFSPITMDLDWFMKHNPEEGGYYVVYDDDYKSYSPAAAFEGGYRLITNNHLASSITALPIEWNNDQKDNWYDSEYGFHIYLEPNAEPSQQYQASWGEGDRSEFETLEEAKEWCQENIDNWIARFAVVAA